MNNPGNSVIPSKKFQERIPERSPRVARRVSHPIASLLQEAGTGNLEQARRHREEARPFLGKELVPGSPTREESERLAARLATP